MTAMTVPQKSILSFIQYQLLKKIIRSPNLNNQKSTFLAIILTFVIQNLTQHIHWTP